MKHIRRTTLIGAVNLAILGMQTAHGASNEALEQRIRELESRLQRFEKAAAALEAVKPETTATAQTSPEVEKLNTKINTLERKLEIDKEVATASAANQPKVEAGGDGFKIGSQDGKHQIRLRAALQADGRFWEDDHGGSHGAFGYTGSSGIPDQFQLRQARFWIEGKLWDKVYFKVMPDFAPVLSVTTSTGTQTSAGQILPDAYLDYAYYSPVSLSAGKQKTPLSLERLQGDSDGMFLERAYPTYLANNRDVGVMLHGEFAKPGYKTEYGGPVDFKNFLSYQLGVFNGSGDSGNLAGSSAGTFDDKEFDGRIWAHPFQHAGINWLEGLGFGVAGSWSHPNQLALNNLVSALGQSTFLNYYTAKQSGVNAGTILAEGTHTRVYPQMYWYSGPFGLMGEYVISTQQINAIHSNNKLSSITQSNTAWQAQVSYVLTGEDNTFQSVKPFKPFDPVSGNWGALQFAGRWSELNVDSSTFALIDPSKGAHDASSWTLGFNWFLNRNALIRADFEQTNYLGGAGTIHHIKNRPSEDVFATRFQLAF